MPSTRTLQEITRMKSYVLSRHCAQPGCREAPAPGRNLCIKHRDRTRYYGLPAAKPLDRLQRRPYVRAFHNVLRKAQRKAENITLLSCISDLDTFIRHSPYISMDDLSNNGLGAERKLCGLLANIRRRWPQPNRAAVNVLASACGTWLAVEVEGDPACKHHPAYRQASIFAALFSLARTHAKARIIEDKRTGKPVSVKVRRRPRMDGRRIHAAADKAITQRFVRFIMEDKAVRKAVLRLVLEHDYTVHYWA